MHESKKTYKTQIGVSLDRGTRFLGLGLMLCFAALLALQWGITSRWFIFALGVAGLNLLILVLLRLPKAWRASRKISKAALESKALDQAHAGLRKGEYFGMGFETPLSREEFKAAAKKWAGRSFKNWKVARDTEQEVQMVSTGGALSHLGVWVAHLALIVALVGVLWSSLFGFQARLIVAEDGRTDYAQPLRGILPQGWSRYPAEQKSYAPYAKMNFEVAGTDYDPLEQSTTLRIYEKGALVSTVDVDSERPGEFGAWKFFQVGYGPGGRSSVDLSVIDSADGEERNFPKIGRGEGLELDSYRFKVLDIQPESEFNRPAIEIEFQQNDSSPEKFWIFSDHRDYDFIRRKQSRAHFVLHSVRPLQQSELIMSRDPGVALIWVGLSLAVVLLAWAMMASPSRKSWLAWRPGMVTWVGWSDQPFLFEPRFEAQSKSLKRNLIASPVRRRSFWKWLLGGLFFGFSVWGTMAYGPRLWRLYETRTWVYPHLNVVLAFAHRYVGRLTFLPVALAMALAGIYAFRAGLQSRAYRLGLLGSLGFLGVVLVLRPSDLGWAGGVVLILALGAGGLAQGLEVWEAQWATQAEAQLKAQAKRRFKLFPPAPLRFSVGMSVISQVLWGMLWGGLGLAKISIFSSVAVLGLLAWLAFGVAFFRPALFEARLPSLDRLARWGYRGVFLGFCFWTAHLLLTSYLSQRATGLAWVESRPNVWGLAAWLVLGVALHFPKWDKGSVLLPILAIAAMWVSYGG
ncbi:cytochrome c biogenesis protein ResB [Bdellovibrionota bacterium FG-1]